MMSTENGEPRITISVHTTTGGRMQLQLQPQCTVAALKKTLSARLRLAKDRMVLLHRNRSVAPDNAAISVVSCLSPRIFPFYASLTREASRLGDSCLMRRRATSAGMELGACATLSTVPFLTKGNAI